METTGISAERTAQEIGTLLAQAGANAVLTTFGKDRKITGLSFKLHVQNRDVPFSLPARIQPVFVYLQKKKSPKNRDKNAQRDIEQAERVAWRQLYKWIQAQLAIIDVGMVEAAEAFFPYIQNKDGSTLWEKAIQSNNFKLLTEGKE